MCLITQSCPLFENPWTIVCHTPLSMGFSRQEYWHIYVCNWSFLGGSVVRNPPANTGDMGSIPEFRRSPGEGNGNSLQYS